MNVNVQSLFLLFTFLAKQIAKRAYIPSEHLDTLLWHRMTKRRKNNTPSKRKRRTKNMNNNNNNYSSFIFHPCRKCHPDEIIGLNLKQNYDPTKQVLVEYIEVDCEFKNKNLVNLSSLLPYYGHEEEKMCINGNENAKSGVDDGASVEETRSQDNDNENSNGKRTAQQWNPEIMKHYLDQAKSKYQKRKKRSDDVPVDVKVRALELFLQRILDVSTGLKQKREEQEKRDAEGDDQELEEDVYYETTTGANQSLKFNRVEDENEQQKCAKSGERICTSVEDDVHTTADTKQDKLAPPLTSRSTKLTKEGILSQVKVGSHILILWPADGQYHNAEIISKKRRSKHVYNLRYDEGLIEENIDLSGSDVTFRIKDDEEDLKSTAMDTTDSASTSSCGATTAMVISQEMNDCEQIVDDNTDDGGGNGNNGNNNHHSTNDVEDSDDSSICSDFVEEYKHKSERIRPGDIIEYYKPTAIFGDKRNRVQAEVLSVDPRGNPKLKLNTCDYLDGETKVRRVKIIMRGKLIDYDKGGYKAITQYKLNKGDLGRNVQSGILQETKRITSIINKNKEKMIKDVQASGMGDCRDLLR